MLRYPQKAPSAGDESSGLDGDVAFWAVNMRDDAAKLPPGTVSYAENCRMENGNLEAAKGCETMGWGSEFAGTYEEESSGAIPPFPLWEADAYAADSVVTHNYRIWITSAGATDEQEPGVSDVWALHPDYWGAWWLMGEPVWGTCEFDDPDSNRYMVMARETSLKVVGQYFPAISVDYPEGVTINTPVLLMQAYERVWLFRGPTLKPLLWDGDSATMQLYSDVAENIEDGAERLPNATNGFYHADRVHVIHNRDQLAISGIQSLLYDPAAFSEVLNFGSADELVAGYSYDLGTVLVFGKRSIYAVNGAVGDYQGLAVNPVSKSIGTIAPNSLAGFGGFVAFLNSDGVWTVDQVDETRQRPSEFPLSLPIQPLIRQINWTKAQHACGAVVGARYYLAVPWNRPNLTGPTTGNNCILVYNIERAAWEPHLYCDQWDIIGLRKSTYNGEDRLFALNRNGLVLLIGEGETWEVGNSVQEIEQSWRTRGYNGTAPARARGLRMTVNIGTRRPKYSLSTVTQGVSSERPIVTNKQRDLTRNTLISKGRWQTDNSNDDHGTSGREDYSVTWTDNDDFFLHDGVVPGLEQEFEETVQLQVSGRYIQLKGRNTQGQLSLRAVRLERLDGERDSLPKT